MSSEQPVASPNRPRSRKANAPVDEEQTKVVIGKVQASFLQEDELEEFEKLKEASEKNKRELHLAKQYLATFEEREKEAQRLEKEIEEALDHDAVQKAHADALKDLSDSQAKLAALRAKQEAGENGLEEQVEECKNGITILEAKLDELDSQSDCSGDELPVVAEARANLKRIQEECPDFKEQLHQRKAEVVGLEDYANKIRSRKKKLHDIAVERFEKDKQRRGKVHAKSSRSRYEKRTAHVSDLQLLAKLREEEASKRRDHQKEMDRLRAMQDKVLHKTTMNASACNAQEKSDQDEQVQLEAFSNTLGDQGVKRFMQQNDWNPVEVGGEIPRSSEAAVPTSGDRLRPLEAGSSSSAVGPEGAGARPSAPPPAEPSRRIAASSSPVVVPEESEAAPLKRPRKRAGAGLTPEEASPLHCYCGTSAKSGAGLHSHWKGKKCAWKAAVTEVWSTSNIQSARRSMVDIKGKIDKSEGETSTSELRTLVDLVPVKVLRACGPNLTLVEGDSISNTDAAAFVAKLIHMAEDAEKMSTSGSSGGSSSTSGKVSSNRRRGSAKAAPDAGASADSPAAPGAGSTSLVPAGAPASSDKAAPDSKADTEAGLSPTVAASGGASGSVPAAEGALGEEPPAKCRRMESRPAAPSSPPAEVVPTVPDSGTSQVVLPQAEPSSRPAEAAFEAGAPATAAVRDEEPEL